MYLMFYSYFYLRNGKNFIFRKITFADKFLEIHLMLLSSLPRYHSISGSQSFPRRAIKISVLFNFSKKNAFENPLTVDNKNSI